MTKYFDEFIVRDEGEYWETGDEKLLEEISSRYNFIIDGFVSGLEIIPLRKVDLLKIILSGF